MLNIDNDRAGTSITIRLNAQQADAIGHEGAMIADFADSMFLALAMARTGKCSDGGPATPADWHTMIRDIDRLNARLEGLMNAAVRAHDNAGGSTGNLADALGISRSTAQGRRESLRANGTTGWEKWADGSLNQ